MARRVIGGLVNHATGTPLGPYKDVDSPYQQVLDHNANYEELYAAIGSGSVNFAASVSASPGASVNNYAPTGYLGGVTNRLLIAALAGGTIITGFGAASDGWSMYVRNTSSSDNLQFAHLSGSSLAANRISCPQGLSADLLPLTGVLLIYVVNQWVFA